ncbi:MAG: hypothetical protein L6R42_002635, partial [Xanthoria sp. 1 TBL-2021]
DYSPPTDSDIINPFSGEPWKPGELLGDNGNEKDGSTPIEYEISPFSGKPFPKPRTQSSSPATPPSTINRSSNSPEQYPQSTQHTTPEKALSSLSPNDSPEKEYNDNGKGKETLQPSEGVPPEQRILNPIRRRRPKPAAADFFEAPPEKPFIVTVEGEDDDSEDDRKKKHCPSSDFMSSTSSSSLSPETIPDNPVPNRITNDDDPSESPVFNDKTMFQPPPSTSTSYTDFLNQTVAAQRQVKAAFPNPKDDIKSDEDEEVDFEDCIPAEPTPGSKGNGYGKKRRGSEDDVENWTDARVSGYGEKENQAPCFDPSWLESLSPEQLGGSVSVIGAGPSTPTRPGSHTDPRARYVPSRPWENLGSSPLPGLGGPTAGGGPLSASPSSSFPGRMPVPNTQPAHAPAHKPTKPSTDNEDDEFEDDEGNQRDEEDEEDNEKDAHWDFYDDHDDDDDQGLNNPNLTPEEQQRFAKAERKHQKLIKRMEKIDAGVIEDDSESDEDEE